MAGSKSNYLENLVINSIIGKTTQINAASVPSTLYIALLNTTANDSWTVTDTGEVGDGVGTNNYSRYQFTNSSTNWTTATTGAVQNSKVFNFTTSTGASTGWGTINSFAIVTTNSTTTGQSLYWGDLTSPVNVAQGNVVRFSTGTLIVGEL